MTRIDPTWENPVRRCRTLAQQQSGTSVITMRIVTNNKGEVLFYTEPALTRLEPRTKINVPDLEKALGREGLAALIDALASQTG